MIDTCCEQPARHMNSTSIDQQLLQLVTTTPPFDIDGVIAAMQSIDTLLPGNDGLKWFNLLYLLVTKEVRDHPPANGPSDPVWLRRLDVVFASFYFRAIASFLNQAPTPSSWQALFEVRHRPDIDRIQFALAGMNAHINRDLSLALLQTDDELHLVPSLSSPQHGDYERVNDLLEAVLPQALQFLATGVLGELAQDSGKIGRLLAIWDVRVARDLAWDFADHLRNLSGPAREFALKIQDKFTGALGRTLLLAF
jgi:hypothetical protein